MIRFRGPDMSYLHVQINPSEKIMTASVFSRLAINDLTVKGMQPFCSQDGNVSLWCNGEIYNYRDIQRKLEKREVWKEESAKSDESDCVVILRLYDKIKSGQKNHVPVSIDKWISFYEELDGVFAVMIINRETNEICLIRDRFGVKPMFTLKLCESETCSSAQLLACSSEKKQLEYLIANVYTELGYQMSDMKIEPVLPSTIQLYKECQLVETINLECLWKPHVFTPVSTLALKSFSKANSEFSEARYSEYVLNVNKLLSEAVRKRVVCSDRPIACLLSGGLDSSIVTALVVHNMRQHNPTVQVSTFSVGFQGSNDLHYAKIVASFLNTNHHELVIDEVDATLDIANIIYKIESHDTTTIRASTPMFILSEYISQHFPHRVIFSGEGADEIFAGYMYFYMAPTDNAIEFETTRLVSELHEYDIQRAEQCLSSNGLELREPFLDPALVKYVLRIPGQYRSPIRHNQEKKILRDAFRDLLPDEIMNRTKAAFSDAVSDSQKKLWYRFIQESLTQTNDSATSTMTPAEIEQVEYKRHYDKMFPCSHRHNKGLWLPRWQQTDSEPSASVLSSFRVNHIDHNVASI